ncbi:hypothetical protein LEP1GSC166_1860 [Leptospira kirschneri]|uniref:hypothetical protein n=1 Tax=Leptospira kirschneri TaxID=29507 RepID=UPI0002BE3495|nr:hypothetical protein [Leptospira kirschneri]EMK02915.1 hypothetical protein LEP1GSC166_1860 [Leptospira kirschneri]
MKDHSFTKSNVIFPLFNIPLSPMRDLDPEELAMYEAFIESKKKLIKKSISSNPLT